MIITKRKANVYDGPSFTKKKKKVYDSEICFFSSSARFIFIAFYNNLIEV